MVLIKRINKDNGEVIATYKLNEDEKIIIVDCVMYIVTEEEYAKYINGEIDTFEFAEAGFYSEYNGDIFKIEK